MGKVPRTKVASDATPPTSAPRKAKIDPLSIHASGLPVHQVAQNWIDEIEKNTIVDGRNKIIAPSISRTCPVCGYTPSSPINYELIRHGESHLAPDDKQYQCPYEGCSYEGATQKCNLKNHIRSIHTKEKVSCDVILKRGTDGGPTYACGWEACDGGRMTRHRQDVHGHPKRGQKGMKKPSRVTKKIRHVVHLPCDADGKAIWPEGVDSPEATVEGTVAETSGKKKERTCRKSSRRHLTHQRSTRESPAPLPSSPHVVSRPSPLPSLSHVVSRPSPIPASPEHREGTIFMVPYVYTPATPGTDSRFLKSVDPTKLTFPPLVVPDGILRPLPYTIRPAESSYTSPPFSSASAGPYFRSTPESDFRYPTYPSADSSANSSLREDASTAGNRSGLSWQEYTRRRRGEYSASPTPIRYMPYPSRESYARAGPSTSGASYARAGPSISGASRLAGPTVSLPPIRHLPPSPPWNNTAHLKPVIWDDQRGYSDYEEEEEEEEEYEHSSYGYREW
ncbi:hypothetical protein PHLGIDRAFT_128780 [Phlebiopsis gigantea 11061_1 CR5-6]|uniref:C2H2-type domain-containing protein n=1 Tax=Phlebiopsis gigantea (strain 11061_1 CR5-6) TaxID=745531 RepID=A0A0C3S5F2_PHLG1|nr:hypothetical protein PHLGIDRAFT_128780 [Phlebiopsis gigantea 11061_1 CR5-6]